MITKTIEFENQEYYFTTFTGAEMDEYQGLKDMYFGEGGFKNGSYLEKFPRESDGGTDSNGNAILDYFGTRKKLAHYENIFANELEAKVDPIFAKDQVRKVESGLKVVTDAIEGFIETPTKKRNQTLSEYFRSRELMTKLNGSVFEICDGPSMVPDKGGNDGAKELLPWVYYIVPLNILGYIIDNDGSIAGLMYYDDIDIRNNDLGDINSDDKKIRVWLKTNDGRFATFQVDSGGKVIADTVNDRFEIFPVSLIEDNERYDENKIAKSRYIGELSVSKKIYNTTSWFNDSFFKNCFAFLAVNGILPPDIDLGNDGIFSYMGDGVNPPGYVAPPVDHLAIMIKEVERLVQSLQSTMNSTVAIAAMASGEARMEADKRRIEKQKQDAQDIQDSEVWLINTCLHNYIAGTWEYSVLYLKDFESLTKADEIEALIVLLDMGMKGVVADQIKADAIRITYANDKERGEVLADLQINTKEDEGNDTFNNTTPKVDE